MDRVAEGENRRAGTVVLDEPGTGPRRCASAEPTDPGGEGRNNRSARRPRRRRSRSPGVSRKGAALRGLAGRPFCGADRTVATRASGTRRPAARGDRPSALSMAPRQARHPAGSSFWPGGPRFGRRLEVGRKATARHPSWGQTDLELSPQEILNRSDPKAPELSPQEILNRSDPKAPDPKAPKSV